MYRRYLLVSALLILFTAAPVSAARTSPLIVDHTSVAQFSSLTDAQIAAAANIRSVLHHASVGNRTGATTDLTGTGEYDLSGLELIKLHYGTKYNRDRWRFWSRGNASDVYRPWLWKIDRFYLPASGATAASGLVPSELNNYDVFAMKMCYREVYDDWDLPSATIANMYIERMNQVEAAYPQKTYVYWTMPIHTVIPTDTVGLADQRERMEYNDTIRAYVRANNKILFDIADIEAYDYRTNPPTLATVTANGFTYVNYPRPVEAPNYFTNDGGHPYYEGRKIVGKAFWVLMAQIAGTPTQTPVPTATPTAKPGDADGNNVVDGIDYMIWRNHYNQTITGPANGDFDNSGRVDGIDYMIWRNNYGR